MPRATNHDTTPAVSRRNLAGFGAALLALGGGAAAAASAAEPDADLIRICAEHVANVRRYNLDGGYVEPEDCPLWAAYLRTRDAIDAAKPQTVEGILAKVQAAKAEAQGVGGVEEPEHGPGARWAWEAMHDLLRLNGRDHTRGRPYTAPLIALDTASVEPDAELIRLCREFDVLEQIVCAFKGDHLSDSPAGQAEDAERAKFVAQQEELVGRMVALPCWTPAGVYALGRSLAGYVSPEELEDEHSHYMEDRLLAAMLRAITQGDGKPAA